MIWICEMEDATWRFSTKELAEKCARFFECEDEAYIYCAETLDDERLLKEIKRFEEKKE